MANNLNDEYIVPQREPMPIVDGTPQRQRSGARFLHVFLYLIVSLIFAFFLVLGGRWVYHKTHNSSEVASNSSSTTSTESSNTSPTNGASANNSTSSNSSSNHSGSSSSSSSNSGASHPNPTPPPPSSTKQTTPPASTSPSQITNTGPGNAAAVFLSVSAFVALAHYTLGGKIVRRRV